jgi:L-ascorbate metabolism protein UlaG (beta-lactamase superfamily)
LGQDSMHVQRLSWAGLRVTVGDTVVLVDALADVSGVRDSMGDALLPVVAPGQAQAALITHLYPDHYDPAGLRVSLAAGAAVYCPHTVEARVTGDGLTACGLDVDATAAIGPVRVTAVTAVDGLGEHQVSWVIESAGTRIIHCGDTLWHGAWWQIARRYGPFDIAFLPINGPLLSIYGFEPSSIPAALTPEQAAAAGRLLQARVVCPIHYGMFHFPPFYYEYPDAVRVFLEEARARDVNVLLLSPGETVDVGAIAQSSF